MISAEADITELERRFNFSLQGRTPSELEPEENAQDRAAKMWLQTLDRGFRAIAGEGAAPTWIYDRFHWGAHDWPVRWRDIPWMHTTDCGLMAALSTEIYRWRGVCAVTVQVVLKFNPWSTLGWANLWRAAGLSAHWCNGDYAYHELTGVLDRNGELLLWDALGRFWMPLPSYETYEGIVALRISEVNGISRIARIQGRKLGSGIWYSLQRESPLPISKPFQVATGGS